MLDVFLLCCYTKGIIVGLDNLDEIIQVVRKASSNAMASTDLMNSKLLIPAFALCLSMSGFYS